MSSSARFLAVILFLVWCMPVSLLALTAAKSTARIARGSVSGRVTIKDKPVSGVMIGLRQNNEVSLTLDLTQPKNLDSR